jgi:ATP-dependent HslUV protease ATP-binding subunit HslU
MGQVVMKRPKNGWDDVAALRCIMLETNGIVFLDEIDKIAVSDVRGGSSQPERAARFAASEGTTVAMKYGP